MGMIYKKGVPYSGGIGGDNSITLTQAEYDALSKEEKNNGTVYYVTDGAPQLNKMTMTQAEYDELPLSVKKNGAVYFITDEEEEKLKAENIEMNGGNTVEYEINQINSELSSIIKTKTVSYTLDSLGRAEIFLDFKKLVNIFVNSTLYICYPRLKDDSSFLVYVRDVNSLSAITSQPTLQFTYTYIE